ncbi:MAG: branched-chain amino acid ABC transporter ATP-binding protein/permease [Actinomycetota bacterium]|nr:branched-chain amino acid ABC transporter ATP-binding protein/permease [Actinomycetota bacterium]
MAGAVIRARRDLASALAGAGRDVRAAWGVHAWGTLAVLAAAAVAPVALGPSRTADVAGWLCTALAAVGLNAAVGLAGIPLLSQGAFMAVGAFSAGLLVSRAGWDPASATLAGVGLALVSGGVVGVVATRLHQAALAVATWLVAWLMGLALTAFPSVSGGAQGLVLPTRAFRISGLGPVIHTTPAVLYEAALVLVALSLLAYRVSSRNRPGLALASVRQGPGAAAALGIRAAPLEWGAVVAAAGVAGAAGALAVQVAGVADPASFGPLRSVELFVAVLLGGAGTTLGPVVGAAVLAALPRVSAWLGSAIGVPHERFEPVLAAVLLLAALVLGGGGLVRVGATAWRRLRGPALSREAPPASLAPVEELDASPAPSPRPDAAPSTALRATGLRKRFGGVAAVDDVDVELRAGQVHALVGPNGSGKSTLLRLLAGAIPADAGSVLVGGRDVTALPAADRVARGIARTLQATVVFPDLTALDHAVAGTEARRTHSGGLRTLLATPIARFEARAMREQGMAVLAAVGLAPRADVPAERLTGSERRLLMIAAALASDPRVLLLDEPAAGASAADLHRLAGILDDLRRRGLALLVVEHNLRLVRRVADRVTVLDAGKVIATGSPDEVAADPQVQLAYMGPVGPP